MSARSTRHRGRSSSATSTVASTSCCALVAKARLTARRRRRLVGDLVAKGPDSLGVVALGARVGRRRRAGQPRRPRPAARCTANAHAKEHHRRWRREAERGRRGLARGAAAVAAPRRRRRQTVRRGSRRHGRRGFRSSKQTRDHLLACAASPTTGEPSKRIEGTPWAASGRGPEHVVFGHDAIRGLQLHPSRRASTRAASTAAS